MKKRIAFLCVLFCMLANLRSQDGNSLSIEYVGNMGVLLSNGKQSVSIDAFHVFYHADYKNPSKELVYSLMEGTHKEYPAVTMALFTHVHGDHFYKGYGAEYVQKNEDALLLAAAQSCEEIREMIGSDKYANQLKEIPYDGTTRIIIQEEVCVKAFKLDHASPRRHGEVQNIAYIVEIANKKVLHVGDSEWDPVKQIFPAKNMLAEKIDVAILPYWMLLYDDPVENVEKYIHPKEIIATHIPPDISKSDQAKLRKLFPGITLFMEIGEVK